MELGIFFGSFPLKVCSHRTKDIVTTNQTTMDQPDASQYTTRNTKRKRRLKKTKHAIRLIDLLLGRIKEVNHLGQQAWACAICHRRKTRLSSTKCRLSRLHCETEATNLHSPYCNKNKNIWEIPNNISCQKGSAYRARNYARRMGRYSTEESKTT